MKAKAIQVLTVSVAIVVAALAGWAYGAYGGRAAGQSVRAMELKNALLEARTAVLDARLDIYSVNFGEASKHLEAARGHLQRATAQFDSANREADMTQLGNALTKIEEAQRLTGQLDQTGNARASEAARLIADVLARQ